ncbi:pyruvate kinase [Candidatus Micrarchaeota archaeon]|nr:pyruvate kinase [Candidatus Micrarchaeota archaeon]
MVNKDVKIIATLGPASTKPQVFYEMLRAGMDIARLNMKYAKQKEVSDLIESIKTAKEKTNLKCEILIDIKDESVISFIKDLEFDYIALAFTETPEQIARVRKKFLPKKINLIAKVETKKGIDNIDKIIDTCDGVMVARGDLGKNTSFESLPVFQKWIIKKCNKKNKFVITATEMLLSMVESRIPRRSESSDVANAVLDGSDALMLSEETAIGKHPILVVKTMQKIIDETQKWRKLIDC